MPAVATLAITLLCGWSFPKIRAQVMKADGCLLLSEIGYQSGKEHGVVFPAYEVAERQSLSFKPTNDITVDFHYTGANMYVLTSQHAGSGALGAEDTKAIVAGRAWFDEASRNMTEALSLGNLTRWTQEELDGVKTMLHEYESWAKDKMAAQKAVGEHSKSRIYTLIHIGYIAT